MTVSEFLATLPEDRRREVKRVRDVVKRNLPKGYEESVSGKMIAYQLPDKKKPIWYAAIASQKSTITLHLMPVYWNKKLSARLIERFKAAGKKLNMGKACIRFQKADELDLDVIGEIVASVPAERWIEIAGKR